jgi:hypothetical protein
MRYLPTSKGITALLLTAPNFLYILLNQRTWHGDEAGIGKTAINLWWELLNHPSQWPIAILTVRNSRPPLFYFISEFFVPLGYLFGSIRIGLLLGIFLMSLAAIFLLWRILDELYGDQLVSLTGCLIMASAPIFMTQSRQFMAEMLQMIIVCWFLYLWVTVPKNDKLTLWLKIILASSLALFTKIILPLFCFMPGILIFRELFKNDNIRWTKWQGSKHAPLLISSFLLVGYAVAWYVYNYHAQFIHIKQSVFWNDLPLPYGERILYWIAAIQDSFFLWPVLVVLILILTRSTQIKRIENENPLAALSVPISIIQIFSFIVIQAICISGGQRFILPILPYFILIISYSLARINKKTVTLGLASVFFIQFIFLNLLGFGFIPKGERLSPFSRRIAGMRVPAITQLVPSQDNFDTILTMDETVKLLKKHGVEGKVILNIGIKEPTISYYAWERMFPQASKWQFSSLSDDAGRGKDMSSQACWERLVKAKPVAYVTLPPGKFRSGEWASGVIERMEKSGDFDKVQFADQSRVLLYVYHYKK